MRLVDASAWVHFLRRKGDREIKRRVAELLEGVEAAHTCPTWFEILSAAKPEEEDHVRAAFSLSKRVPFEAMDWEQAALLDRDIRSKGIVIPRNDLLVATVAISRNLTVLCRDSHFEMLKKATGGLLKTEQLGDA